MRYTQLTKNGNQLSVLGYGCMRLPMNRGMIDEKLAEEQILRAINTGVNYFDTAYIYHMGKSEVVLGTIINKHELRDQVFIADKLPVFMVNKPEAIEKLFNVQLKRLSTSYIDYYLMHSLSNFETWQQLKDWGILEFITSKKQNGSIRQIGFSFHGNYEEFEKILLDYDWDFCQIQYNYLDIQFQAGEKGLKLANQMGIGVIVMEPLRGGNLANAPDRVIEHYKQFSQSRTPVEWALKWLWNQPEVGVVLSGMNQIEQIDQNCMTASHARPGDMTEDELNLVTEAKSIYLELMKVPCTGCGYCMPCPFGVDIPSAFSYYNSKFYFKSRFSQIQYLSTVVGAMSRQKSGADLCSACGRCEPKCPQSIKIIDELKHAHRELDSWPIRTWLRLLSLFTKSKKPQ